MKMKFLMVALLASAAVIGDVQAGHHGGGGGYAVGARPGVARGGGPAVGSMPMRSYAGSRMGYSGQRFYSGGMRSPGSMQFRPQSVNSNFGARQRAGQNFNANRFGQTGNNSRIVRSGNGFARNNNSAIRNRTGGQFRNGSRLAPNWRNHAVAQHSANWHRDWDHHHDHFFHGNRFVFIDGFWWGFGLGFNPWWWDYPYYGYGYDYPYNYGYGYNYGNGYDNGYSDQGVYDSQPAYQNGYDDQSGNQNGYNDQSANSTIAGAQDRLTRDGYYSGQIDGVMGPETRHAIVRFQTKHGLRISGELTTETLDAMGLRQSSNYGSN